MAQAASDRPPNLNDVLTSKELDGILSGLRANKDADESSASRRRQGQGVEARDKEGPASDNSGLRPVKAVPGQGQNSSHWSGADARGSPRAAQSGTVNPGKDGRDQTQACRDDLRAFDQAQPEIIILFNEIKDSIHKQMGETLDEIKEAFNKKLVKLFMPKVVLDLEQVFKASQAKLDQCFNENVKKLESKFSKKLSDFEALNEQILSNYERMAIQN